MPATVDDPLIRAHVPESLKQAAQIEAVKAGVSLSEAIRQLLTAWIEGRCAVERE